MLQLACAASLQWSYIIVIFRGCRKESTYIVKDFCSTKIAKRFKKEMNICDKVY